MNIYAGNLSYTMTDEDLKELFVEYGPVKSAKVIMDRETGRSKGFGFIEMETKADGEKAVAALDGTSVNDRSLRVNESKPREEKPRRNNW